MRARCLEVDQPTSEGLYTHVLVPSVVAVYGGSEFVGEGAKRLRARSGQLGLKQNHNIFFDCKNEIGLRRTYHTAASGYRSATDIAAKVLAFLRNAALDQSNATPPGPPPTSPVEEPLPTGVGLPLGGDILDRQVGGQVGVAEAGHSRKSS